MSIRAHFFDVFDTCLVRTRPRPEDVLRAVAEQVVPPGETSREEIVAGVARCRVRAEEIARERREVEAVGLDTIYAEASGELRSLGVDAEAMAASEVAFEEEQSRPVAAGARRVAEARAAGLRIVFVSDMYLPAALIRRLLERTGIAQAGDPLYVSGELGVTKHSGRLFSRVLALEDLHPREVIHHGDDPRTDLASAAGAGLGTRPLLTAKPSRLEDELQLRADGPRDRRAHLAGLSRVARVTQPEEANGAAGVAAAVVAPLFCAWVAWTLLCARTDGVQRLYFVSRDGQLPLAVARVLRSAGDPEVRYLYGSRQAWLVPSLADQGGARPHWLLEPTWGLHTPTTALTKLLVEAGEVGDVLARHGLAADTPLEGPSRDAFWNALAELEPLVAERAAAARDRLLAYLDQEEVTASGRWALVDIGWTLSTQAALRRVLAGRVGEDVLGYYLATGTTRRPWSLSGPFRAFLREDFPTDRAAVPEGWLLARSNLVEQVFAMADHGSCTGYARVGDHVEPVLRDLSPDPRRDAYRATLWATVLAYAEEVRDSGLLPDAIGTMRSGALAAGRLLLESPLPAEAEALGHLRVGDDQNETRSRELAGRIRRADLRAWAGAERRRDGELDDFGTRSVWREGTLALSSPLIRGGLGAWRTGWTRVDAARVVVGRWRRRTMARKA